MRSCSSLCHISITAQLHSCYYLSNFKTVTVLYEISIQHEKGFHYPHKNDEYYISPEQQA